ncbi:MAG: DUF6157 family protein [Cytophagaceae bacterium]
MLKNNIHTTNYENTFIEVAADYKLTKCKMPNLNAEKKTIAAIQFDLVWEHPYEFTSDDVLFQTYAIKQGLSKSELSAARKEFFSKGQACFRASPLTKTHGFGVHSNEEGKIALYPLESPEYKKLLKDAKVEKVKAMRTSKK